MCARILFFVVVYHRYAVSTAQQQLVADARAIEPDVWSYAPLNLAYLTLAAQTHHYDAMVVTYLAPEWLSQTQTQQEIRIPGPPPLRLTRWLMAVNLVPVYLLQTELAYGGKTIGALAVTWYCTTIYTDIYVAV